MEIKQDTEFIKLCKEVIADYVSKRIDKTGNVKISTDDVYVVWSCKTERTDEHGFWTGNRRSKER